MAHSVGGVGMLYDRTFPPDDVEALWHMVPGDFTIEWVTATSTFVIKSSHEWDRTGVNGVQTIHAKDSFDFERWMAAFRALMPRESGDIMSPRSLDLKE